MKKLLTTALVVMLPMLVLAQGWPTRYEGVMLQGFYWDSYGESRWPKLESQADELAEFFKLVWVPQSASCGSGTSMGYDDLYWLTNYTSSFGSEAQLRSMINTFKSKGIGTIADVVINHRKSINDWVTFPTEVYKGVTYKMLSTDICKNDDGGETLKWATANGYSLSSNNDSGEDWGGMRDLDHRSANVQNIVKVYVKMLLEDLGYAGFRYDMVKGYSAQFTGMYNSHAGVQYSVGEYWDGNMSAVKNWIDGTKVDGVVQSAAFDFPFRYTVRDAANGNNWYSLGNNKGLNSENSYKRYAVTFIENHDTEYRSASAPQDPISKNVEAGNAYMLAMPGTPCVFLKHWIQYKESIKQMIYARQLAGIFNTSMTYNQDRSQSPNYYVQRTVGSNGTLLVALGSTSYTIPSNYVTVTSGTNYRLALSKNTETAWASKPSGEYNGAISVTLTAVSQTDGAQLVYTLDGSEPTASNGTRVSNGSSVTINKNCTFKAGLLINGAVSGVITRYYSVDNTAFEPYEITVYLKDPTVAPNNWSVVNYYCWDSGNAQLCGDWPGQKVTDYVEAGGYKFYFKKFNIKAKDYYVNFVFNQGPSNVQTEDVTYVNKTAVFEVTSTTNKYTVADVTDTYLPIIEGGSGTLSEDVNGDGEVNINDVNGVIDAILSGKTSSNFDVNGDGEVNIIDINAVIDYILG